MTIKKIVLPMEKAAFIQSHCAEFGCTLIELGVTTGNSAKVSVSGADEDVKKLFNEIGE